MPFSPIHGEPSLLHKVFWTEDQVPGDGRPFALALANKGLVGGLSKAYQNYWNRCFAAFNRFHAAHCDRLLPTIVHHARLVSEEKAISLSEKRNLPFTSKSREIVGDFLKLKIKLEKSGSHSVGKNVAHGKQKQDEGHNIEEKRQAVRRPKKFIPKVAASGPPSPKRDTLSEPLPQQQPVGSGSSKGIDKVPEASSPHNSSKTKGKGKVTPMVLKNEICYNDESGAAETVISTHRRESTRGSSGMDEDPDEGQYYSRDEDTSPNFDIPLEELGASNMPPEFASDRG
ncbi:hypothetical protein L3X38_011437 [Prunus dulcis]|uniref:Uncharacterized protein n=1 Tax=Prunus dulcis TaxID=3755 RepID=A0AAD4WJV1_PRUDU|nr:hypothetical protein L3X38_011437 [Prunus dulcis]